MIIKKNESSETIESVIIEILDRIHTHGPNCACDFETLSFIKKFYNDIFSKYERKIMHLTGLFYKASPPKSLMEAVYNMIHSSIKDVTGHSFTPVQAKTYQGIRNNKFYTFSAPTSTGKSYLFRKIVQEEQRDVVIILPSRALIAEYIYTLREHANKEILILQFIEDINKEKTKKRIYVVTPERGEALFEIISQLDVGLLLFDEAQLIEDNLRGLRFDAFVQKCIQYVADAKIVFAHPFVHNPEAQLTRHKIIKNCHADTFSQLTVGKIHLLHKNGNFEAFSPYKKSPSTLLMNDVVGESLNNGGAVMIYVSKTKLYSNELKEQFSQYINQCDIITDNQAQNIIEQVHKYIGDSGKGEKKSRIIEWMKRGIVVHHGSLPLKMRLLIEKFVNAGFAKLCFATSTLIQGINMPFDVVWIDNFRFFGNEEKKILDLKNLIGRAGRTTQKIDNFDFGYVIINNTNKAKYIERINKQATLSSESKLFTNIINVPDDEKDIVEGFQKNEYDVKLRITTQQKERILKSDIFNTVKYILNQFHINGEILSAEDYYKLKGSERKKVKESFQQLYTVHLRRQKLTIAEQKVLSTAIPVILWRIQGKSFREILSLRLGYITQKSERIRIKKLAKEGSISKEEETSQLSKLVLQYSPTADYLPNSKMKSRRLFQENPSDFDYDKLIYDTYDYIDKVIGNSISDPICAVLQLYYNDTSDDRALTLINLIRHGTADETEIWLLKYGYSLDDMEWLVPCIQKINASGITFNDKIDFLDEDKKEAISRYI